MSQFLPHIRQRLLLIAESAAAAVEALSDAGAIDLPARHLAELLVDLDRADAKLTAVCERLAGALDPQRIAG